ncbi:unnamed protein product [Rhizoctonia solani]|uniref:Uncharacterized protein n=1 Tax=Rhizoctonia solani TaxID=456999 RepID=A0A8H2WIK0_9AGAM|nr:unnamed protein product [Rhizoctonia solani]
MLFDPVKGMSTQSELLDTYGSACRLKGALGMDEAANRIEYIDRDRQVPPTPIESTNIDYFAGHKHRMQRKTPAATAVAHKLKKAIGLEINSQGGNSGTLDLFRWLNATALEVVGEAGFNYSFSALESNNEHMKYLTACHNLRTLLSKLWYLTPILPWALKVGSARFRRMIVDWIPFGPVRELRDAVDIVDNVATKVYRDKRNELGKTPLNVGSQMSRDVMSSLLMQNSIVSSEEAMNEEELISQVNAVTIAAHDSTSTALARTIYILAQFPEFQSQLREEVREAHEIHGEQLNYDQLNSLPFLDAVCRESLRLYAPGLFLVRVAQENCSIPLLYPARPRDKKGEMTRVFVDKGTYIYLSLDGANRDLRTWGEDANVFRPSRWLDSTPSNLHGSRMPGIYSSLMTFSGGPRACIGFRFSQLEMKLLLTTLVSSFKFELSDAPIMWRLESVPKPYVVFGTDEGVSSPSMPMRVTRLDKAG